MTTKQVLQAEAAPAALAVVSNSTSQEPVTIQTSQAAAAQNLYISVKTFDGATGRTIGERIVDLFHYGTRNWVQKHLWWGMQNGHCVEINVATEPEVTEYLEAGTKALAAKFNTQMAVVAYAARHPAAAVAA